MLYCSAASAYNYNQIKKYINELHPPIKGQVGSYGFVNTTVSENTSYKNFVVISIAVLLFGVVTTIIVKKYHKEN
ncbi:MAG: hypothetical protein ACK5LT_11940 [Lachnospirales bacterium]